MAIDLNGLLLARLRLNSIGERIALIESVIKIGNATLSGGCDADLADRLKNNLDKLEERERTLLSAGLALDQEINAVMNAIRQLPEPQSTIIRLRYADGLQWSEIADRVHHSDHYCMSLGRAAVAALKAI